MKYKITRQLSALVELFIGEMNNLTDANVFITKILEVDQANNEKFTYWEFENEKLISTALNQNANLTSRYASGKEEFPFQLLNPFSVNILENNKEKTLAKFLQFNHAKLFAEEKASETNTAHFIFDGNKLVEKIDKSSVQSGSSNEKQKVFRPTPMPKTPRLGPGSYWIDEEDDDKNK